MGRHEFTLTTPSHGEVLGAEDTQDQASRNVNVNSNNTGGTVGHEITTGWQLFTYKGYILDR